MVLAGHTGREVECHLSRATSAESSDLCMLFRAGGYSDTLWLRRLGAITGECDCSIFNPTLIDGPVLRFLGTRHVRPAGAAATAHRHRIPSTVLVTAKSVAVFFKEGPRTGVLQGIPKVSRLCGRILLRDRLGRNGSKYVASCWLWCSSWNAHDSSDVLHPVGILSHRSAQLLSTEDSEPRARRGAQ